MTDTSGPVIIGDAELWLGGALDCLRMMPERSIQCCVTSPPYYGLRDYGHDGQIGLEPSPDEYVARLVAVFAEVRRALADDGVLWLNIGDSYAAGGQIGRGFREPRTQWTCNSAPPPKGRCITPLGLKHKDMIGIPWLLAFALRADGWYLRQECIWHKPNPMPESVTDRCTKAHESLFLLSKAARYFWDAAAIAEQFADVRLGASKARPGTPELYAINASRHGGDGGLAKFSGGKRSGRNRRSVWTIPTIGFPEAHFAVMPEALVEPCILAGSRPGDTVLDPFLGAGTVAVVAHRLARASVGVELNAEYLAMARRRIEAAQAQGRLFEPEPVEPPAQDRLNV